MRTKIPTDLYGGVFQSGDFVKDIKGKDIPFLRSGAPGDKQQAPESAPNTAAPGIYFSSPQDPRSWDPYAKDVGVVITCISNGDAKKAEKLFNDLLVRAEKAEARSEELESSLRDLGALYAEKYSRETGE